MNYHNIEHCSLLQGEGCRVVLWVSGCGFHCKGCHNKQTWDKNSGLPFDDEAKAELMKALSNPDIDGITFLGGEPLMPYNYNTVMELMKEIKIKFPKKNIWCYTGYVYESILENRPEILKYIDVLVDGQFIEELKNNSLHWVGSSNQRVLKLKDGVIDSVIF